MQLRQAVEISQKVRLRIAKQKVPTRSQNVFFDNISDGNVSHTAALITKSFHSRRSLLLQHKLCSREMKKKLQYFHTFNIPF